MILVTRNGERTFYPFRRNLPRVAWLTYTHNCAWYEDFAYGWGDHVDWFLIDTIDRDIRRELVHRVAHMDVIIAYRRQSDRTPHWDEIFVLQCRGAGFKGKVIWISSADEPVCENEVVIKDVTTELTPALRKVLSK